jgi:protein SCO1/2
MTPRRRKTTWLVWGGLILLGATLLLAFMLAQLRLRLQRQPLPVLGQVAEFTLTNQNGQAVSLSDLLGHVWVADVIFTRCPGPCRRMTQRMKEIQSALPASGQTKLVTLTTDPDFDTPAILKKYAENFGADPGRWLFLTGPQKNIAGLAIDSLKLTAIEKKPEERESANDLFVHSTIFVVVDQKGQLRRILETEGEGVDPKKVTQEAIAAIRKLEKEQ